MKKFIAGFFAAFVLLSAVTTFADGVSDSRLDQVLRKQDEILKELAEIKSELQIIKVRATIR